MPANSEAVAERIKQRDESFNAFALCAAGTFGVALLCGIGKMVSDLKKTQPKQARLREPWELS